MISKYFVVITFISLLLATSCNKVIDEFYLSQEMKMQIPFEGYEQITFKNNIGELEILKASERHSEVREYQEGNFYRVHKTINETEWIIFENDNNKLVIRNSSSRVGDHLCLTFTTTGKSFVGCFYTPLNAETLRFDEQYHDSLSINDIVYYKVFSDSLGYSNPTPELPHPKRIYYTIDYGVIKIEFTDGTAWELKEIEWAQ